MSLPAYESEETRAYQLGTVAFAAVALGRCTAWSQLLAREVSQKILQIYTLHTPATYHASQRPQCPMDQQAKSGTNPAITLLALNLKLLVCRATRWVVQYEPSPSVKAPFAGPDHKPSLQSLPRYLRCLGKLKQFAGMGRQEMKALLPETAQHIHAFCRMLDRGALKEK
jgi:hypothetical protein